MIKRTVRNRYFKESDNHKEINTMQDLVDYISDEYRFIVDTDLDDLDSWGAELESSSGRFATKINAHTDDDGDVWFGCDYIKSFITDIDERDAKQLLNHYGIQKNDRISEDEIEEMVYDAVDELLNDNMSYSDFFSDDVKLPCNKKDIDNEIIRGEHYLDEISDKLEDDLIREIKKVCKKQGIIVESKKTNIHNKTLLEKRNLKKKTLEDLFYLGEIDNSIYNTVITNGKYYYATDEDFLDFVEATGIDTFFVRNLPVKQAKNILKLTSSNRGESFPLNKLNSTIEDDTMTVIDENDNSLKCSKKEFDSMKSWFNASPRKINAFFVPYNKDSSFLCLEADGEFGTLLVGK